MRQKAVKPHMPAVRDEPLQLDQPDPTGSAFEEFPSDGPQFDNFTESIEDHQATRDMMAH